VHCHGATRLFCGAGDLGDDHEPAGQERRVLQVESNAGFAGTPPVESQTKPAESRRGLSVTLQRPAAMSLPLD
jgi:hypothetical protein